MSKKTKQRQSGTLSELSVRSNSQVSTIVRQNKADSDDTFYVRPPVEALDELLFTRDFINETFYNGRLPDFIISYIRKKNVTSHFAPNRFQRADGLLCHEVLFNAEHLGIRPQKLSIATIAYECTRVARYEFGGKNQREGRGANGYHDKIFATMMKHIGLQPSDTGLPGGKETGSRMGFYIITGGKFDIACEALLDSGFRINWHSPPVYQSVGIKDDADPETPPAPKKDRLKFTCSKCGLNAWAKPEALLTCTLCKLPMSVAGSNLPVPIKN